MGNIRNQISSHKFITLISSSTYIVIYHEFIVPCKMPTEVNEDTSIVKISNGSENQFINHKNHKLTPTCFCIDSNERYAFTASKDGSIIKWCLQSMKKLNKIKSINKKEFENDQDLRKRHHHKHINCISISFDDKYLATGGWDKMIRIYSPKDLSWIHTFNKHRQEVTALAFRQNHLLLYSGSADRSVMLWTLEEDDHRCFVDDLYGHESTITSIDILKRERVLTAGGRDQSIRVWKIVEQAQTVFESKHQSVDIARYIDDRTFVSGGEDGTICVWTMMKRKPIVNLTNAHPMRREATTNGDNPKMRFDQTGLKTWISALATFSMKQIAVKEKTSNGRKRRKLEDGEDLVTGGVEDDSDASSEDDESSGDEKEQEETHTNLGGPRNLAMIASGSCNSEVKIWLLIKTGSKYELKLHQTVECHGFVNDLRFINGGSKLVAVCGPEHKFGRWWRMPKAPCYVKVMEISKPTKI